MPFQSEKQRRYLWANEPEIARDWADTYGSRIEKNDGGISQLVKSGPGRPGYGGPHETQAAGEAYGRAVRSGPRGAENWQNNALAQHKAQQTQRAALRDEVNRFQKEKREEKVERFRNKKTFNKRTRDFFLDKVLDAQKWGALDDIDFNSLDPSEQEKVYGDYMQARGLGQIDAYGNPLGPRKSSTPISPYPRDVHPGTGGDSTTEPEYSFNTDFQDSLTSAATTPDYFVGETPLASNLEWGKKMGVDPRTMGLTSFAANGGRIPAAFGGIMDTATGRRAYGLGSIFKSIGKAAKKVLKSPIGKAAILYAGGTYLGGMSAFGGSGGSFMSRLANPGNLMNLANPSGWSQGNILNSLVRKNIAAKGLPAEWGNANLWKLGILGTTALPFFMGGPEEDDEGDKGSNYDVLRNKYAQELMNIKAGVSAGSLNPNQWSYLPSDYTYTGAEGGRAGYYAGGQSIPSDYTMEDAMMTTTQDKLGGITEAMKRADLNRQGSVGQFYAAQGGRIGADEGGLMDLGGMEKDYRNDGGFVPLGGEEKADDVPARLSRNEVVFTADAVRGAGGGDIDKGAEIMENVMKNLEQGGQVSEETQGLAGAREMFGVSERLSEVV